MPDPTDPAAWTDQQVLGLSQACDRLAHPARLRILLLLRDGELSASGLGELLGMPEPTLSYHLGELRLGGLLGSRRDGHSIFYSLAGPVGSSDGTRSLHLGGAGPASLRIQWE